VLLPQKVECGRDFGLGTVLDLICSNKNSASLGVVAADTLVVVPASMPLLTMYKRNFRP